MNRNMIPIPVALPQNKLTEIRRDLDKSKELFENKVITYELHELHVRNLTPKIKEYEQAIQKLLDQ